MILFTTDRWTRAPGRVAPPWGPWLSATRRRPSSYQTPAAGQHSQAAGRRCSDWWSPWRTGSGGRRPGSPVK